MSDSVLLTSTASPDRRTTTRGSRAATSRPSGTRGSVANPREAALQGLAKARALAARGYAQAVLPPHERPDVAALRALGFSGSDADVVVACRARGARAAGGMLVGGGDVGRERRDGEPVGGHRRRPRALHAGEPRQPLPPLARSADDDARAARDLRRCAAFRRARPVAAAPQFGDEGAANYTRFAPAPGAPGVELFVYGRVAYGTAAAAPRRFPARQTREACAAIARRHGLDPARTVFAQQNPDAIDAGVFHNDVIAVGHGSTLLLSRAGVGQAGRRAGGARREAWATRSRRSSCPRPR